MHAELKAGDVFIIPPSLPHYIETASGDLCFYSISFMPEFIAEGIEYATRVQAESPIVDKWNEYMKDVMVMPLDPETGAQPHLEQVFFLE